MDDRKLDSFHMGSKLNRQLIGFSIIGGSSIGENEYNTGVRSTMDDGIIIREASINEYSNVGLFRRCEDASVFTEISKT